MDATHSYNPSSTQKGQNIDPSEIHDLPYQSATQTRFLPPIDDLDDNSEDDDDDMPPGIMVDDLPILPPPVMFTHDNADEGVPPPGIMLNDNGLDFHDRNQGEANEEGRLPPHSGSSAYTETSGNINEPTSESGTPDARTGPLTFNYTFLPDMSLATASDGSSGTGITDVASSFGEYNSGGATDHPMESTTRTDYDSGSIQSVAYPAYPITSYPPTSYHRIPRPPNAFILFRSAFIRSRKISSDIEGNHSTLSKIIGRLWRNLPPDERAEWEARARLAQEEHRQRYPDWRFSPAGGGGVSGRRRGNRGRGRGRGRGRLKAGQGGRTSGSGASAGDDSAEAGPPLKQDKGKGKEREVDSDAGVDDMSSMGSDQAGSGQDTRAVVQVDSSAWPIVRGASSSHAESSKRVLHRSTTSEIIQDSSSDFDSRLHSTSSLTMYPRSLSPQERDDPAPLGDTLALGPQESTSSNPSVSSSTLSPIDEQKKYYSSLVSASHVNPDKSQEREGEPQAPQEQTHNADSHSSLSLREVSSVKKEADARVDAIADMLIRGYEGKALEAAVQQWETAGRKESDRRMLDSKGRKDKDQRDNGKKGKTKEAETNPIEDTVGQEHALEEGFRPNIEVSVLRERQIGSEIAVREQGQNENRPGHTHDLQSSDLHVGEDAFPEGHDWFTDYNSGPTALLDSVQTSRSSSSNETERERGRAGGEWGLFNTVDATAGPEHFASPNALFPTSIPITRVFLKRSLSEPAAPRPTRPRLQLPTEENIETAEKDGRDEGGVRTEYHEGYPQFGLDPTLSMAHSIHPFQSHEELPTETSRPPEDTVYPSLSFWHLSSSDFSGGRYALRRHHANSYPAVTPGSARGRSGYPMSPHPNPIPTYTTSLAPPQVLVRRSEDTVSNIDNDYLWSISTLSASPPLSSVSRTTSSDPGMLSTLAFEHPLSPYSFSRPVAAAMGLHDNNESDQHWEYDVSGRSESGSPIRSEMHTGFPSAPLPYNPTFVHGNEIYPRRRASSTRSSLIPRDTTPTTSQFSVWHLSTNSNMLMPSAFEEARRRPLSRASPPPSSPASPVNELRPGRRNIFPVHEHRRTSTWGGRWSNRQPSSPASYASPSPTPSLSPHREPVAMHTNQTWEQVENDRRRELASESPLELERIHEAGENKSVDITQLMSTEQMGWEQTRSSWPLHHAVSEEEMASTQTRQVNDLEMSPTTWTSASVGRTGYVASIIDPQLSASEPYLGSPKTSQDLADVRLEGHSMPSTAHLQPSNFTSSSYSSLSGWAGEENSPSVLSPSPFDDYHYPSGTGVLGDPVTNSTTPSPPFVPQ